jgi:hypothetical protein
MGTSGADGVRRALAEAQVAAGQPREERRWGGPLPSGLAGDEEAPHAEASNAASIASRILCEDLPSSGRMVVRRQP